jgi:hypothetical protein
VTRASVERLKSAYRKRIGGLLLARRGPADVSPVRPLSGGKRTLSSIGRPECQSVERRSAALSYKRPQLLRPALAPAPAASQPFVSAPIISQLFVPGQFACHADLRASRRAISADDGR